MYKNIAPILKSFIDKKSNSFINNKEMMLQKIEKLNSLLSEAELGGGQYHLDRLAKQGKLPVRKRIKLLLDPDTPFLEISPFAAHGTSYTVGGGCVVGVGLVAGKECVIFANDPSVLGGAMTVYVQEKWMRAIQISRDNKIPFINFVESAGADLRGAQGGATETRQLQYPHFASSGRSFYEMTELSKLKIPVISVVFGSSTAGGAYQPGMSDYNIFIRNQSKAFLAGPPLVQMATGEISDDETLGGAKMHSEISGFSDYLAENDSDAIRICRNVVNHLNIYKKSNFSLKTSFEPAYDSEDLLGLFSDDLKTQVDIREVIMRIVDESRFEEYKPLYDSSMVCGWANVFGYPIGILGNNGPIYPETAEKSATFIQLCNQTNTPIVFLHNVTGFLVGKEFE
ncbi:MAG: carboxyl transferase domain-containing protein, partial [Pseudomonadota bacterium]|nr:carboxyl transferase domain-containing protein [Pseudomonadota bacterium]